VGFNAKQYVTMRAPSDSRTGMRTTRAQVRAAADTVAIPTQPDITKSAEPMYGTSPESGMVQKMGGFIVGGGAAFMLYLAASTTMSMLMGPSNMSPSVRPAAVTVAPMIGMQYEATNIDPSAIARSYTKPVEAVESILLPSQIVAPQVSAPTAAPITHAAVAPKIAPVVVAPAVVAAHAVVAPAVVAAPVVAAPVVVAPKIVAAPVVVAPVVVAPIVAAAPEVAAAPVVVTPVVVAPAVAVAPEEVVAPVVAPEVVSQQVSVSMESSTPVVAMQAEAAGEVVAKAAYAAEETQAVHKTRDHMSSFYGYTKTTSLYSGHK